MKMNSNLSVGNRSPKKILVLTSGYQRWPHDQEYDEDFVVILTQLLSKNYSISVLSPKDVGSAGFEIIDKIRIYRHSQSFFSKLNIAHGSGIVANLKKNKILFLTIPFYLLFEFIELLKITTRFKFDLLHAHWLIPQGFLGVLYKKILNPKIRILVTCHGSDINCFNDPISQSLKRFLVRHVDEITAVSEEIKQKITKLGFKKPITVCPMGVNTAKFTPNKYSVTLRQKLGIKKHMLLFVGNIVEAKGIRFLIEAMPKVLKLYPATKLIIIGNGNLKDEMEKLALTLKINHSIVFLGKIKHRDLPPYFASADIFILPSLSEGFPLVISEALSSQVPVVTSSLPTFIDFNQKSKLLTLSKAANPNDLADKIITLLQSPGKLLSLQNRSRQYAVRNLDWRVVSDKYAQLINSILTSNPND